MPAYILVNVTIHDQERFAAYGSVTAALVERFGGRYIVLGGAREVLEGTWPEGRTVLLEWPTRALALAFWHSPEYAVVQQMRAGISEANVVLVDGLPSTVGAALPWVQ